MNVRSALCAATLLSVAVWRLHLLTLSRAGTGVMTDVGACRSVGIERRKARVARLLSLLSGNLRGHSATVQRDVVDGTTIGDTELRFISGRWRSVGTVRIGDIGRATHGGGNTSVERLKSQLER